MAKRELIYKDEARRAVLTHAPGIAWCIDSVKPICVVGDEQTVPKMDEYWVARIGYWSNEEPKIDIVIIYYVWENGEIDFIPCAQGYGGDPIRTSVCESFELIEKINMEKYK